MNLVVKLFLLSHLTCSVSSSNGAGAPHKRSGRGIGYRDDPTVSSTREIKVYNVDDVEKLAQVLHMPKDERANVYGTTMDTIRKENIKMVNVSKGSNREIYRDRVYSKAVVSLPTLAVLSRGGELAAGLSNTEDPALDIESTSLSDIKPFGLSLASAPRDEYSAYYGRAVSKRTTTRTKRFQNPRHSSTALKTRAAAMMDTRPEVLAGVILPVHGDRPFTVPKVAPALEKAVDKIATGMFGAWNFKNLTLVYADSECDTAVSMNEAVIMAERKKVVVFFGPVCDYAVAPVGRQSVYWNIPIITTGATAYNFHWGKAKTYRTLTRVGPANIQGLVEFYEAMFLARSWRRLKVLYDSTGQDEILHGFCHLLVEYMHNYLMVASSNITMDHHKLDMQDGPPDFDHVMREEIGADHAGE